MTTHRRTTHRCARCRPGAARGAVLLALALAGAAVTTPWPPAPVAATVTASGPSVTVTPTSDLDPAGASITVTGRGFDPNRNNGVGIYAVFGPRSPEFWRDANLYGAAKWIHPRASASPGQAPMAPDGSFTVTLEVTGRYTDGNGTAVDCVRTTCYVITMAAHGVADRSQDTFTELRFRGGTTPTPTTPPVTPGPSPTVPAGTPATAPSPRPGAMATPAGTPGAPLPTTGTEVFDQLTLGLGLLAAGLGLLVVAGPRRLRTRRP